MTIEVFPAENWVSAGGIYTLSDECSGTDINGMTAAIPAAAVNVAQLAYYCPLQLSAPFIVRRVGWLNGGTVGNGATAVGVYSEGFSLLVSGSATTAGASVIQYVDVTDTVLDPGRYYMAFLAQHATDTTSRFSVTRAIVQALGWMEEASLGALPSTATPITPTTAIIVPVFGILQTTT